MRKQILFAFVVISVVFSSCASQYEKIMNSNDTDKKYQLALQYFKEKRYKRAIELFDNLNLAVQGTPQEDTVAFYHGLSTFNWKDYQSAETMRNQNRLKPIISKIKNTFSGRRI